MKISQLFAIPLLTAIAGITAFGFAAPTKAQYLGTNCTATVNVEPDSRLNVRSGAGTNFATVRWSLGNGDAVTLLNDRPKPSGASPLSQKDRLGNDWNMVLRGVRSRERPLARGLAPKNEQGWVRADFLRVSCPP
jgi:hypothetical protein